MEDTKPWYASKTIWSSIASVVAGVGIAFGLFDDTASEVIKEDLPNLAEGLAVAIFGAIAFWGRISAKKTIGSKDSGGTA